MLFWLCREANCLELQGSKSVAKRKQAEVTASGGQSAAKKLRVEMKQRGHEVGPLDKAANSRKVVYRREKG